jgi:phosphate-selective porin OprO/OprP
MKSGLGIQSLDGANTLQLTGRLHADYRAYDSNATGDAYQDRFEVRRARFGVRGQVFKDFKYEIVGDFGGSASSSSITDDAGISNRFTGLDVAYIDYAYDPKLQFRVGRFKMPFSLEQLTSSNNIDFMERSLAGQNEGEIIPAKETGAMVFGAPTSGVTYALALSRGRKNVSVTEDSPAVVSRLTANLAELRGDKSYVAHVGLGYSTAEVSAISDLVSARTEARESDKYFTNAAASSINAGSTRTRQGLELAGAYDAFKFQGEYFKIDYSSTGSGAGLKERGIDAYYVQVLWNITGESHNYSNSSGTFGWVKPKSQFTTSGGTGAWQAGIRYSKFDASEFSVAALTPTGADAITYGLTWIMNDNVRVMLNYVQTNFNGGKVGSATAARSNENAVMARAAFSF